MRFPSEIAYLIYIDNALFHFHHIFTSSTYFSELESLIHFLNTLLINKINFDKYCHKNIIYLKYGARVNSGMLR